MICRNCGQLIKEGNLFCTSCGSRNVMTTTNTSDDIININTMNIQKTVDDLPHVFCPNCRNKVKANSKFCSTCGYQANR